jgi:hypothetical protein
VPAPKPQPQVQREKKTRSEEVDGGITTGAAPPIASMSAPPPPPAPVAAPQPVTPPATAEVADAATAAPRAAAKVSGGFVSEANAGTFSYAPAMLFDISIPRSGAPLEGPALIQHFAAPAEAPDALRVDVEAAAFQEKTLLRVSVDTPEVEHAEGGSRPPIGADATLDVAFDDDAVASHRALAGTTHASEAALPSGTSVTALYQIELKPGLSHRATVATVTLRYRSVADGKKHVVTQKLRVSDVRAWHYASKRTKGASLGAALVYGFEPAEKIAERARAAGLDELAEIAKKR